ncbi:MAG TPA: response regulator transcription factor [Pyrinomonadaceae bacterium]|jgi:CheY-like chemotaxis protein|nr:response regulator transcription factor [Pyrinomonadaceae bacterium]
MKILIAEDDPVSRRVLEATLLKWGYEVLVATNGADAWEILQGDDAPSLAILDIMMPGIDGLEVCRRVRQSPSATPPYLILLTAMASKDEVVNGIQAGANDYLSKPFHREELKARVGVGAQMLTLQKSLAERVKELEQALSQVKQLQGMLPICSYCKKIRNDQNYWQKVEGYISDHTDVEFSHGICPDCHCRVMDEVAERRRENTEHRIQESEFSMQN